MNGLNHLLNIGALATWLSVAGFGTVGVILPAHVREPLPYQPTVRETEWVADDFTLGETSSGEESPAETETPAADSFEPLPAPPELPALAALEPLPAIPSLPAPIAKATATEPTRQAAKPSTSSSRKRSGTGQGGSGASGSVMSDAARIAAGHKPKPAYPFTARLKRQSGTVFVTFTVGKDGRVMSAYASKPCAYPLLNDSAVSGVRQWRFPPGGIITRTQPITFTLE